MSKPLIIYHADCTDGYAAAWAAWGRFGNEAEYLPMTHSSKKVPKNVELAGRDVYILDFSLSMETTNQLLDGLANKVIWLDHHKTSFEMWTPNIEVLDDTSYTYDTPRGDVIVLDNAKSGAMLAWEFFNPSVEPPMGVKYIDDRDRWQFKILHSKEFHAGLASLRPWNFDMFGMCMEELRAGGVVTAGIAILSAQNNHVDEVAKHNQAASIRIIRSEKIGGSVEEVAGRAVNSPLLSSEIGHSLAVKSGTYGLVWFVGENGKCKCSLRSEGDYDVSRIAKHFGGGGHLNAAGFEVDVTTLLSWLN